MLRFLKGTAGNLTPSDTSPVDPLPMGGYKHTGTPVASELRAASGNSGDISLPFGSSGGFFLNVTGATGTAPTLDVTVRAKDPASGVYFTIGTFAQKTAAGNEAIWIGTGADNEFLTETIRIEWVIGGTFLANEGITFSVGYCIAPV